MLPCEHSGLQPSDWQYKKGLWDSSLGTAPCVSTVTAHKNQIFQHYSLHNCTLQAIKDWRWEQSGSKAIEQAHFVNLLPVYVKKSSGSPVGQTTCSTTFQRTENELTKLKPGDLKCHCLLIPQWVKQYYMGFHTQTRGYYVHVYSKLRSIVTP